MSLYHSDHFTRKGKGGPGTPSEPLSLHDYPPAQIERDIQQGRRLLLADLQETDDPRVPYEPTISAIRAKTNGYATRYRCITTGQVMHLLSRGEMRVAHLLDHSGRYKNIRAGFPLPVLLTFAVAAKNGLRHHYDHVRRQPAMATVDFICTDHAGAWSAIDYKPAAKLTNKRVQVKFDIVRRTLAEVGIRHVVMTELDLPEQLIRNLEFLHQFAAPVDRPPLPPSLRTAAAPLMRTELKAGRTVYQAAQAVALTVGCPAPTLVRLIFWFIGRRHWHVDLTLPVHPESPLALLD